MSPLVTWELLAGDCVEQMRAMPAESIDAIVCDPPYGINFMGKAWDAAQIEHAANQPRNLEGLTRLTGSADGARKLIKRSGSAFATKAGEAGSYDFSLRGNWAFHRWCTIWATECLRVLKPGGHLLAFGGTRTYHRLVAGVEDAGFEIRDQIAWMFGQGFPKSLDVARAIDVRAGADGGWRREDHPGRGGSRTHGGGIFGQSDHRSDENPEGLRHVYEPGTDQAREWQGWGTTLKPAFEPVVVARKPLAGTVAENVLEHGVGALNIDACRVGFASDADEDETKGKNRHADFGSKTGANQVYGDYSMVDPTNYDPPGRWPANVMLTHHEDCVAVGTRQVAGDGHWPTDRPAGSVIAGMPGHAGQDDLDERYAAGETVEVWDCHPNCPVRLLDEQTGDTGVALDEAGGASRFFYSAKVSRAERNAGLGGFEARDLNWSSGEQNPGSFQAEGTDRSSPNHHPTVKPVEVMRWLLRLVTPPGGVVLDPFLGSGSTGIAAVLEGFRFVGIEREAEYLAIAEARIAWWARHGEAGLDEFRAAERAERIRAGRRDAGQLDLFA